MLLKLTKTFFICVAVTFVVKAAEAQLVSSDNLNQNADQSQGQYMPMNMGYAGFNSLGMTQSAWLDPLQNLGEGQTKPAYSRYFWTPDLVLPIRVREGMMTLINFPDWEMVEDIFIGDNSSFDGQISGPNTILLYPRKGANVGVDTNVIVFGRSGNRYVFYVKSEGVNTERITNSIIDIEVIDGPHNGGSSAVSGAGRGARGGAARNFNSNSRSLDSTFTRRFQKDDWIRSIPLDPSSFRFDIEIYVPNPEDVAIAPERVWRDEIFTYIDMGEKALNMAQRPIVTMIVERIEVPVGFRSRGPNNRLIVVEGIGDMVLRNGKRLICLKMRRSDDVGLDRATFADRGEGRLPPEWDVPGALPPRDGDNSSFEGGSSQGGGAGAGSFGNAPGGFSGATDIPYSQTIGTNASQARNGASQSGVTGAGISQNGGNFDYSKMHHIRNDNNYPQGGTAGQSQFGYGSGFVDTSGSNISIELGTDANVEKLEALWSDLLSRYPEVLGAYEPFFSVDTPADGQGRELFHLRIGPVKSLETGDNVCSRLGRNGIFCSVVRTQ